METYHGYGPGHAAVNEANKAKTLYSTGKSTGSGARCLGSSPSSAAHQGCSFGQVSRSLRASVLSSEKLTIRVPTSWGCEDSICSSIPSVKHRAWYAVIAPHILSVFLFNLHFWMSKPGLREGMSWAQCEKLAELEVESKWPKD